MSLPSYLASIKSSGIYRFEWDKSQVTAQQAETLRLLIGYSEKGPFNTAVYCENFTDFAATYGNISKRLEHRGCFFHRLAEQALSTGPILALNLKPFADEEVQYQLFDASEVKDGLVKAEPPAKKITEVYDTNKFWALEADSLPDKLNNTNSYISLTATDSKETSCSFFIRRMAPDQGYNMTIREWYNGMNEEMPEYLEMIQDDNLMDYFAEIYVFRGKFTPELCGVGGVLSEYFDVEGDPGSEKIKIKTTYTDSFGDVADALQALAEDSAANYIGCYQGCLIPYFKNGNGTYVALDLAFNADNYSHKMLMKMDESKLYEAEDADALRGYLKIEDDGWAVVPSKTYSLNINAQENEEGEPADYVFNLTSDPNGVGSFTWESAGGLTITTSKLEPTAVGDVTWEGYTVNSVSSSVETDYSTMQYPAVQPIYLQGYDYTTVEKTDSGATLQKKLFEVLSYKGIRKALTSRTDIEYHYIVDSFTSYYPSDGGLKAQLATICKEKKNSFAILNFPDAQQFKDDGTCMTPIATGSSIKYLDFSKVVKKVTLVSKNNGASYCGYFTPLVISDGTVKTTIPSAALVSNNFMEKWGARHPYDIVAGPNYGVMTWDGLQGPDYAFARADLDQLEPFGVNCMVYVPRKGTYINSNQTAQQTPVTALSKINVRELVIYLQDEIEYMMEGYHWDLNTQALRDTIKSKADTILETVKNNGGVYKYNNWTVDDADVIDNEMVVLRTEIEPARGAGKMVEEIYIHKTGALSQQ